MKEKGERARFLRGDPNAEVANEVLEYCWPAPSILCALRRMSDSAFVIELLKARPDGKFPLGNEAWGTPPEQLRSRNEMVTAPHWWLN
jgi:hypothetical protein